MAKLSIVVATSRSGKSDFALQQAKENPNLVVLSRDDYRYGYRDAIAEQLVTEKILVDFYKAVCEGKDILVADTNLSQSIRNHWIERSLVFKLDLEFIIFKSHVDKLKTLPAMDLLDYPDYVLTSQTQRFNSFLAEDIIPSATYTFL